MVNKSYSLLFLTRICSNVGVYVECSSEMGHMCNVAGIYVQRHVPVM